MTALSKDGFEECKREMTTSNGESLKDDHGDPAVEGDPYTEEGGEG